MTITTQDVHRKAAELTAEGAPFALREFSVDGDRFRGFANAPANLVQLLQAGRAHGEATFLGYAGRRLSYREFFARVDALAAQLVSRYGIDRGDRIAIAMRNTSGVRGPRSTRSPTNSCTGCTTAARACWSATVRAMRCSMAPRPAI